jgi:hypothetical protein
MTRYGWAMLALACGDVLAVFFVLGFLGWPW